VELQDLIFLDLLEVAVAVVLHKVELVAVLVVLVDFMVVAVVVVDITVVHRLLPQLAVQEHKELLSFNTIQ
jgi:hypothetical protein